MKYTIISPRIGTVGKEFVPEVGMDLKALVFNGFIKAVKETSDSDASISAKTKAHTKKD